MTQIKCKSFKASHAQELDEYVNRFLEEEKVSEIVHVSNSGVNQTTLVSVTLFYKCEEEKPKRTRQSKPLQQIKNDEV